MAAKRPSSGGQGPNHRPNGTCTCATAAAVWAAEGVNILKTHYGAYQRGSLDYSYHQRVRLLRISQAKGQTHLQHFKCLRHKNALSTVEYVNIALIKGLWNRKMPRKGYDPEPVLIGEWGGGREGDGGRAGGWVVAVVEEGWGGGGGVTATTGVSPAWGGPSHADLRLLHSNALTVMNRKGLFMHIKCYLLSHSQL